MDLSIIEALLSMVHEQAEVIYNRDEAYVMRHRHSQQSIRELEYQGMLDADWMWMVDVERMDMVSE